MLVPPHLPDHSVVRNDILDYYVEIERFDQNLAQALALLEARGILDNTLVVVTSDNGMPFPRAKASLYDYGTCVPLAIRCGCTKSTFRYTGQVSNNFFSASTRT